MSGSVFLAATEIDVAETAGTIQVTIQRAGSLAGDVTVLFGVAPDSATAGIDYIGAGGSIIIPDGVASVTVPITILDDALGEATEVVSLTLISASGAALLAPRTVRISILDNETPAPPPLAEPPLFSSYALDFQPILTGLGQPIRFTFNPLDASQVFLIDKTGVVRVADLDTGVSAVFLDLSAQVNSAGDRGLLGIALHPDFATTPYVYLYYVVDPPETAGLTGNAGADGGGNRYSVVVRYTADAATGYTSVVPGSEVVLLGGAARGFIDVNGGGAIDFTDPTYAALTASDRYINPGDGAPPALVGGIKQDFLKADSLSHNGGAMVFGPDGALYIATGDAVSYNFADPRAVDVQSLDSLSGKILRIDPITGLGLADNPFAVTGDLDANRAKVFQYGLRNPFSFTVDDQGRVVIGDVGWFSQEEINFAGPGANFGWPYFEGGDGGALFRTPQYRDLPGAAAFYAAVDAGTISIAAAFRAFSHAANDPGFQLQAIIGSDAIIGGTRYPTALLDDYLFADFNSGRFYSVDINDRDALNYLGDAQGLIHLTQGADGWIYYANIYTGTLGRLGMAALPPINPAEQGLYAFRDATVINAATGDYRLNFENSDRIGGVASVARVDMRQDARFVFDLNLGNRDANGADGMGFALHNAPQGFPAIGDRGGALGLYGLSRAIAIEFDTYVNNAGDGVNDAGMIGDHSAIFSPSNPGLGSSANGRVELGNIEDGLWHRVEVTWDADTQTLSYSFDGIQRDSLTADLINGAFGGSNFAHFLFTGATGGAANEHRVRVIVTDVTYENVAGNQAPILFGGATRSLQLAENTTGTFLTPTATDADGDALTWRIAGGADAARFTINAATGALAFVVRPDFEAPADVGANNTYNLVIEVADPAGLAKTQAIEVVVTDTAFEGILGTNNGETLVGTAAGDTLNALGGDDTIIGDAGNDTILAGVGDGADSINGGAGIDLYSLEATSADAFIALGQRVAGSADIGTDVLFAIEDAAGGAGNDLIQGSGLANLLLGLGGADTLQGLGGDDRLEGGQGHDRLEGGLGNDTMLGGAGNDTYVVNEATDVVTEVAAEGTDTVIAFLSTTLGLHLENLTLGGSAAIDGTGNALDNAMLGNSAANLLRGEDGADSIQGGNGGDTLVGGLGADTLDGGRQGDSFVFNNVAEGGDRIVGYRGVEDSILVSASGFGGGLTAGMNILASGRYAQNTMGLANAPIGTGQFVYETDAFVLRWDPDGRGAATGIVIAEFIGATGFSGGEIIVIA
jgi:glucose/arabinose dehydrogenase